MFIQLRMESGARRESLAQDEEEPQNTEDLTSTNEEIASSIAGSRMSHKVAEQLKDMVAYFFINIHNWPPEEEWAGQNSTISKKLQDVEAQRRIKEEVCQEGFS